MKSSIFVMITGFGAFKDNKVNPSARMARTLATFPIAGTTIDYPQPKGTRKLNR